MGATSGPVRAGPRSGPGFRVLGPVEAVDGRGTVLDLGAPRTRALLAALLVHRGTVLSVDRLVDLLWDGDPPATARTMVHGAVAALRRALASSVPAAGALDGGRDLLVTGPGGYVLDLRPEQVDADRFEELLAQGRRLATTEPQRAADLLARAQALWRGPALAGLENRFAREAAARWEELRLDGVEARMTAELASGHHREGVTELEELVSRHPFRERLCALLVLALYRSGRQADALAALRAARRRLGAELGLSPGPELQGLEDAVLRHSPELQPEGPLPPAWIGRPLPAAFSSFVGRDRERSEVGELVLEHRLVTLTGPGGSGKSRLAREVCAALAERGAAEVSFGDLARMTTPELVGEAVAEALGVRAEPGHPLAEAVRTSVAGRTVVVLLDNCEHLADACAVLLGPLLSAVAGLHVLLTSRVLLRIPGEHVYPVGPLPLAGPDDGWRRVAVCDAVRLFADRVAAARRGFAVTEQNAGTVLDVCRHLDGLPLALELVAARAATMPLGDLAQRLPESLRSVDDGSRPADVRHRSLTATIAWSRELLSEPERTLFARISVFPAAFSLTAAEDVASGDGLPRGDIALLLSGLVASSTVDLLDPPDGSARYRLLQTTRQYGRGLLDDATAGVLRRRHAEHYLRLAETARPHLFRPGSAAWLRALDADRDHFRAALEWAFGPDGDPTLGAQLIGCLWHPWDLRGARREGLHWVDAGLRVSSGLAPAERLVLLSAGTLFHLGRAEFAEVGVLAAEQRGLARTVGDRAAEGDALALEATVAWARGAYDRARHLYEDAIALSLAGGDPWGASLAEAQLARLHRDREEPDAAGVVALRAREHADAVGEELARGLSADVLASLEHRWGDPARAAEVVEEALAHYRAVGYLEGEASALHLRGRVALSAGEPREARADLTRSLALCRRIGLRGGAAAALEGLAGAALGVSDDVRALRLLAAAAALREEIGTPLTGAAERETLRLRGQVAARLGPGATEQVLRRARALPLAELLDPDGPDDSAWLSGD